MSIWELALKICPKSESDLRDSRYNPYAIWISIFIDIFQASLWTESTIGVPSGAFMSDASSIKVIDAIHLSIRLPSNSQNHSDTAGCPVGWINDRRHNLDASRGCLTMAMYPASKSFPDRWSSAHRRMWSLNSSHQSRCRSNTAWAMMSMSQHRTEAQRQLEKL